MYFTSFDYVFFSVHTKKSQNRLYMPIIGLVNFSAYRCTFIINCKWSNISGVVGCLLKLFSEECHVTVWLKMPGN